MRLQLLLLFFVAAAVFINGCSSPSIVQENSEVDIMTMKISSPTFVHNTMMPRKYTCQGNDLNPPLLIEGIPINATSLVLIVDDPDAPIGVWDHWIVWNIPLSREVKKEISEGVVPKGAIQGVNSWGNNSYGGPCPPTGTHRYFFKVYALDKMLDLSSDSNKNVLEESIKGHTLAKTEMIGLYKKT